ncbi:MAG: hypothetical protein HC836_15560 [Richelia sp. RM2_1_2]|nr:hypothetical protein [Richelia sp. RM2_1_2]
MADKGITYSKRTFTEVKEELISLVQQYYPEVLSDFTDSNVGAMMIDLNAGVANNLSVNTDRAFQETQLQYAQQRASILNIAKNLGFNIPNKRPSVTVVDFTVNVPARGDQPDASYYPVLAPQSQVVGSGKIFETDDVIDYASPISNLGYPNRSLIPVLDSNGNITSYSVTKREVVINGSTKIFKKIIRDNDVVPFLEVTLPDNNVISIDSIILLPNANFTSNPPDELFNATDDTRYYEVDYLAQQRVLIEDVNGGTTNATTGATGIKAAKWIDVTRKFIKEFTDNGLCKVTFGNGNGEVDFFNDGFAKAGVTTKEFLNNYLENTSLGEKLKRDHTLFIRYRVGGGSDSNLGSNVLTALGQYRLTVNGSQQNINRTVERSLRVTNPIPAIGGNDGLSIEEIRHLIAYNFSGQYRAVTINDYLFQVNKIPGKFGSPFRTNAFKEDNKVVISIIGLDSAGKLTNTSNTLLKQNITEYLTEFRMVNDYVEVRDGRIFNLAIDVDLFIEEKNENQIANNVIRTVIDFFDINELQMNEDVFMGPLQNTINDINGVINILSLKVYNKVGNGYSLNPIQQVFSNPVTGEIQLVNNTVYSCEDSMFEIRYPEKDIRVFLRKRTDLKV